MEWINPEKRRYYRATVQHDLLGFTVVVRDYGSLDTARGGRQVDIADSAQDADRLMQQIAKVRRRHGYVRIASPAPYRESRKTPSFTAWI